MHTVQMITFDISAQSVGTKDEYKIIVLNQKQRDELRKQLAGRDLNILFSI